MIEFSFSKMLKENFCCLTFLEDSKIKYRIYIDTFDDNFLIVGKENFNKEELLELIANRNKYLHMRIQQITKECYGTVSAQNINRFLKNLVEFIKKQ